MWSPETASLTTLPFTGVATILLSSSFDFQYEMDVNPSGQDLDSAGGAADWFASAGAAIGVDRTLLIPQSYDNGVAVSNQLADPAEALFRTDYGGSISRQSLAGDFTVEVAVKLTPATITAPGSDLGGFGFFLNPGGQNALRVNVNESEITTGLGNNAFATGSNTDAFHLYRIAYVASDRRFWVWRDGVLIYGGTTAPGGGIEGAQESLYAENSFLLGDFAVDLSGEWEVDYIRLHNEAVAPDGAGLGGGLRVTRSGFADGATYFLEFTGVPNTDYQVTSSTSLTGFATEEIPANNTSATTDGAGVGRVEIDVTGRLNGRLFFRLEE